MRIPRIRSTCQSSAKDLPGRLGNGSLEKKQRYSMQWSGHWGAGSEEFEHALSLISSVTMARCCLWRPITNALTHLVVRIILIYNRSVIPGSLARRDEGRDFGRHRGIFRMPVTAAVTAPHSVCILGGVVHVAMRNSPPFR